MSNETRLPNVVLELPPLRILIVEDDPMMQLGLEQSLEDYPQLTIVGQASDGYLGWKQPLNSSRMSL